MNVLITGVTSFIGRALARELISEGYEVYGVVRPTSKNREGLEKELPRLHVVYCDMDEADRLSETEVDGKKLPKMMACVHFSWDGAGKLHRMDAELQKRNEDNTLKLISALKVIGCERFIFAGSQAEYGVTLERVEAGPAVYGGIQMDVKGPVSENRIPNPISEYGKSKLRMLHECRRLCDKSGITYIHLRIYSVYGVGDHPTTLVSTIARAFTNGENVRLSSCEQLWDFIYITDAAKAIADLVSCVFTLPEDADDEEHVVNIASGDTRILADFVKEARDVIGKGSYELGERAENEEGTPFLNPDVSRLRSLTGFEAQVSFAEGIERIKEVINE